MLIRIARLVSLALCVSLLANCATQTRAVLQEQHSALPVRMELTATPFFAQEKFQCGPAALAMSLTAAGFAVSPEVLQPEVYIPAREGSLQPDMIAAARRHGALALTITPKLQSLLMEVAAGHAVVVLQNLGLGWLPRWHYAVVIGFDLEREEILLRSGPEERQVMTMRTFEHTWARSQYWGMLALKPGDLPADPDESRFTSSALAFEKTASPEQARRVYESALGQWPDKLILQLGLGNTAYLSHDLYTAEAAFRSASHSHPDSVAALNNLASVLQEQDRLSEALRAAQQAVALGGPLQPNALETLASVQAAIKVTSTADHQ